VYNNNTSKNKLLELSIELTKSQIHAMDTRRPFWNASSPSENRRKLCNIRRI